MQNLVKPAVIAIAPCQQSRTNKACTTLIMEKLPWHGRYQDTKDDVSLDPDFPS